MKTITSLALVFPLLSACGSQASTPSADAAPMSTIDDAIAEAETGRDPAASRARLEAMLADGTQTAEDRGRVALALSRLAEAAGDQERAIALTEQSVALGNDSADARLFLLLTGKPQPNTAARRLNPQRIASSSRALSTYWPAATPDHKLDIEIYRFGGLDEWEGTPANAFDVGAVLRDNAITACGYCEDPRTKIHTHTSQTNFWSDIPRYESKLDHALVVVYVDSETIPPSRYGKWLATSTDAIEAAFARGDGLVAVKDRPAAPPLVTIAAPRFLQLEQVETAFSNMAKLPFAPVTVSLQERLAPAEIRSTVRSKLPMLRGCYDALLARNPSAAGSLEMSFTVGNDGTTRNPQLQMPASLEDATFRACIESAEASLRFPVWSHDPKSSTTVKYPITLTP